MPQVSADALLPWSLAEAEDFCRRQPALWLPSRLHRFVSAWPMADRGWAARAEGDAVRVVRRFGYSIRPAWLETAVKPGMQLALQPLVAFSLRHALRAAGAPDPLPVRVGGPAPDGRTPPQA